MYKILLLLSILSFWGCVEEIPVDAVEEEVFVVNTPTKDIPQPLDLTPPTIYSERYLGTLNSNSTSIVVSLKTTEPSTCKYQFQDADYKNMTNMFNVTNNGLDHEATVSLSTNPKEVFIKCADIKGNETPLSKVVDLTKPAAPPVELTEYNHFSSFINSQCMSCHQAGGKAGSWDFSPYQSEEDWKNSSLVQAGNALKSKIYYRLKNSEGSDGPKNMPSDKNILVSDVAKIKTWIDSLKVDPEALPIISFVEAISMINEDGGSLNIKLKLNKASNQTVTVNFGATSGTAMLGSDFTILNSVVSFNPGQLEKSVQINIINSDPSEMNEAVIFSLSDPKGANLAGIVSHTLSIIEIDKTKPVLNGLTQTIQLTAGQSSSEISFTTSEAANCSFARTSNQQLTSMTSFLTTGNLNQKTTIDQLSLTSDTLIYIKCIDSAQNVSDERIVNFIADKPFTPFGGMAHVLPGRIEAEAFDQGANGVAYFDTDGQNGVNFRPEDVDVQVTTDTMGGDYNLGWVNPTEWFQYTVNIAETGVYHITARTASNQVGPNSFTMSIGGKNIANFSTGSTGGWQTFQNLIAENVILSKGLKTIRVTQNTGNVNINYFIFDKAQELAAPKITNLNCSDPVKVNELFMCRVKLEGTGAKLEFDSNCDWLRIGGGGADYVAVGTPRQYHNNCRITLRASSAAGKSEDIVKNIEIQKDNSGTEVCQTPALVSYNTHIKPLIQKNCLSCHDNSSEAGGINYEYVHENNYSTFDASPETRVIWAKTIEQIRWGVNDAPPKMPISLTNGRQHFSKCEVKVVEKWMGIEDSAEGGLACNNVGSDPGEFVMHRLNNLEFKNTLTTLMQDNSYIPDVELPEEAEGAMGFTTMALSQYPNLLHTNGWWQAVEKFAAHYIANKSPANSCNDDNCARTIIRSFATNAFRRNSVNDTYFNNLMGSNGPYLAGKQEGGVKLGIESAIQVILMSPQFLMHYHERNSDGIESLNAQELANRIAYTLWQSPPDQTLRNKANDNSILNENIARAEVTRMLADSKSSNFTDTFVYDWMGLKTLKSKKEELAILGYPGVNVNRVLDSSVEETKKFFSHIVQKNRNLNEILTANYTFVNQDLADFYNLPSVPGTSFVQVNSGDRRGILTHASVLAAHSKATATSPTGRGEFILDKFLCEKIGSPPATVNVEVSDAAGISRSISNVYDFVLMATTEKVGIDANKKIVGDTACIGCHSATDPIGVTFESYDSIGKERQLYGDGVVVRTHANYNGSQLNNSSDLIDYVDQTQKFKACLTKSLYHYSIRRDTTGLADSCMVQEIANGNENNPSSIIDKIFSSDSFKKTRGVR